jgi:diguanylate cyclase (GGDEF)-like protein
MNSPGAEILAPASLRGVVHRAHLGMALVSMAFAGVLLLLSGLVALRVHLQSNLELMARSVAYTVEAAVVFNDADEAKATLARLLERESVASAEVRDARGAVFAQWRRAAPGLRARTGQALARLALLAPAVVPIQHEGESVGEVELSGDGQGLLSFVLTGLAVLLACTAVSGVAGIWLSRRMLRDMVTPLQELARVARAVRREGAAGLRVPPARLAELRELGDDFNALLDELENRQEQLTRKNAELTHRTLHDYLTGLPNRASFEQRLQTGIDEARRSGATMALLFLDCDCFKQINDTRGHAVGDALLVEVARRVQAQLRPGDAAARLGGDEFAVVMAPPAGKADAQALADRVQAALRAPLKLDGGVELHPAMSVGMAVFPQQGEDMESLLRCADAAMYQMKAGQRRRATDHVER